MKLRYSATLVVAMLATGSVHAQQTTEQPGSQPSFEFGRLDKNKDGFLSRQEAQADKRTAALFDRADTNKDGKLSEDELTKARAAQDREKAAEYSSDAAITTKVKAELLTEKGVPSTSISVETQKGVVHLTGAVENAEQIKKAGAIAAKVKGVKSVTNSLTVKKG
jgi:osmotically-inducible protein OsmY